MSATIDTLKALVQRQVELAGPIERAITNLKKIGEANLTARRVQGRLDALRSNWKTYRDTHARILDIRDTISDKAVRAFLESHTYFKDGTIYTIEETFLEAQEDMENRLDVFRVDDPATGATMAELSVTLPPGATPHGHRLPRIDLPHFSGNPRDWLSFRDLFFALVGSSPHITNVEKLHYLKTSVSGIASQRIESIGLTNDNFAATWDYLSSIYDDKRLLVNTAMRDFMDVRPVAKSSGADLDRFNCEVTRSITALETLGQYNHHCDAFVVYLVVSKLDPVTVREWEESLGGSQLLPTWVKLLKFLEIRARSLQAFEMARPQPHQSPGSKVSKGARTNHALAASTTTHPQPTPTASTQAASLPPAIRQGCSLCSNAHYIAACQEFRGKTSEARKMIVNEKHLCYNCLGPHRVNVCRSQKRCQTCDGQHHTLLHAEFSTAVTPARATPNPGSGPGQPRRDLPAPSATVNHVVPRPYPRKTVLLTTALVRVQSSKGVEVQARALLDTGSELSFITESLAQTLKLSRRRVDIPLVGIGNRNNGSTRGAVSYTVRPHFESSFSCKVDAVTLPKLTSESPPINLQGKTWEHLQGLQLADPDFSKRGRIDVLLGADVYGCLLDAGVSQGPLDAPVAHHTKLGWVLSGPTSSEQIIASTSSQGFQCSIKPEQPDFDLQESVQRFWIQEEAPSVTTSTLTSDEEQCESHFVSTHSRDSSGRYIVRLPFKTSPDALGDSRPCATRMLARMQRRFQSEPNLQALYTKFLQEYETLGHMQLVPEVVPEARNAFYLPHHGVIKDSSTTTKLRVVFNGSARSTSGYSLNDVLHTGAKLQTDLSAVILRWQRFQFAFSADIEKMFRQIQVHRDDWDYQTIVWSPYPSEPHARYQLTTVTYGLGPAPFLALRVLQQLVQDEGTRYPLASDILRRSTYVDDSFGGADTLQEAQQIVQQLDNLCMAGGFKLQKWIANYSVVLSCIDPERLATTPSLSLDDDPPFRALGIAWKPSSDSFVFTDLASTHKAPYTKRKILSRISQLFDPLGWLAPVTIRAKILMQDIWIEKVGWDDVLPDPLQRRWEEFLEQMKMISQLTVPRWLGTSTDMLAVEIHGFSDASEHAMASVVYLRVIRELDDARLALLGSKTKVSPLKRLTIPRLELTAAALLARHVDYIRFTLDLVHAPIHLWTDSTIALTWIQSDPARWKDYVRNRVTVIRDTLPNAVWHHVPGHENPADCASRGLTPQQLKEHRLWWAGPKWLALHSTSWPISVPALFPNENLEERSKVVATTRMAIGNQWDLILRYSSLTKLLRITALCRRVFTRRSWIQPLTPQDLSTELNFWVRSTQVAYFSVELRIVSNNQALPTSNPLSKLTPFMDPETGLLRLGGRLRNTLLDPDTKHPSILPRKSPLTTLLIADAHLRTLHGGTQVTLAYLRRNFWVLGGRTPVRSFILRCVVCARHRGVTAQQLMGQLPEARITPTRPFLHSGVDYAGPFTLKAWRGRTTKTHKGYIVLFVCFSTSAIHLEMVTDYSTDGFLAAFKRFTGRRGICATLTSDCGTNLVGADRELRKLFDQSSSELGHLSALLANDGTEWRFNPPSAPHFGGKWEAGVKSVKFHLRRVIGNHILTYEEISTLLTQVEAVLNSRPLCPLSEDPTDVNALTPGHFLVGSALASVPEPSLLTLPESRLSRWQLMNQMLERFWTRWTTEYLQRFQAISKWRHAADPVQLGSLVLISDERYPPSKWPLARVIELHPGKDGLTRVVTVKTQGSTFKRPVVKLCPLPLQSPDPAKEEL